MVRKEQKPKTDEAIVREYLATFNELKFENQKTIFQASKQTEDPTERLPWAVFE